MRTEGEEARPESAELWSRASVKAGIVLAGAVIALAIVPDRLVASLTLQVPPRLRDLIVLVWVAVSFVALCWALVAVQRGRGRRP